MRHHVDIDLSRRTHGDARSNRICVDDTGVAVYITATLLGNMTLKLACAAQRCVDESTGDSVRVQF